MLELLPNTASVVCDRAWTLPKMSSPSCGSWSVLDRLAELPSDPLRLNPGRAPILPPFSVVVFKADENDACEEPANGLK